MEGEQEMVSLWLAKATTQESLDDFLNVRYSDDGNYENSSFGNYFKVGYYNESFKESEFLEEYSDNLEYLLEGFSYEENIIPRFVDSVVNQLEEFNAVIMLYNYDYSEEISEYNDGSLYCKFICSVSYRD
jgi:Immunity protein 22